MTHHWTWVALPATGVAVVLAMWGGANVYRKAIAPPEERIPTTRVKRGDVPFTVTARGELQGGNSQMLTAPMMGGAELIITSLRQPGELVKKNDVVVQFDVTEQTYKLREAEADLAESEQQVLQAQHESEAKQEEDRNALLRAQADLDLALLEARKNPMLAAIQARQNELAVEAARNNLTQLQRDLADRGKTSRAAIAIQEAARHKAKVLAETARRNIESMTLKASADGYVSILQNTGGGIYWTGMQAPLFQAGDTVRPGMAVAQIPDLKSWEVTARISELDRGHLATGQQAEAAVVSLSGKRFAARIDSLGGTFGPPWERRFECKLALLDPSTELRPGMTANLLITTGELKEVLWLPAQALFTADGRNHVFLRTGQGFSPRDVKLVRRSESRVVVEGLTEGQEVALASPDRAPERKKAGAAPAVGGKR